MTDAPPPANAASLRMNRRPWIAIAIGVVATALLGAGAWYFWGRDDKPAAADAAKAQGSPGGPPSAGASTPGRAGASEAVTRTARSPSPWPPRRMATSTWCRPRSER